MTDSIEAPVNVGIVGLGGIGNHHSERITELGHNIVAGVDVSEPARESFARKYDVDTYASFVELIDTDVEAIVITTPNKYHEKYAVAALEAGYDVLLEKPLAHTLESAERIAQAAHDADGFCMVGFNNRFAPAVEVFKSYQRAGRFGEVNHVEANYVRRRGVPGRGSWFTTKEIAGGGSLIDIGVHAIDLAMYFLDFPEVVEVSGTTHAEFGSRDDYAYLEMWGEDAGASGFDVEDAATALIRCADGKTISLEVAWATNRRKNHGFHIDGSNAGAHFDRETGALEIFETGRAGIDHFSDSTIETTDIDLHKAEDRTFLEAVGTGDPPQRNTVDQALAVQRIIDGIYRSDAEQRAVRLD
ncbi:MULTISPECIES: Gfo/Idh/MocA family protein [unclassified Haladaptatus]|uniref:Gfo/Idh/MocA family protein n=1 Tax=unclassified Haladaptatus TaxID=2622732 RepID=UPI0023E7AEE3|nr:MULTISPECIES: Gfo/Idh/MocA family oxidoreductase [unclassified Haladaptatus]